MTKAEALKNLEKPEIKALMGPDWKAEIKRVFDEATRPDLSEMLAKLRQACAKRAGTFKTAGFLTPDEKQWTAGILQELEETVARVKGLLAASPEMATERESLKVRSESLRLQAKIRRLTH